MIGTIADDDVVEEPDAHNLRGLVKRLGELEVLGGWCGIAARRVGVDHDHALCPDSHSGAENVGRRDGTVSGRAEGHHEEWYAACVGDKPYDHPRSGFAYSAPFTEMILLGCIAQRVGGRLEYDPAQMRFTNSAAATGLISKPYRSGWEFKMD